MAKLRSEGKGRIEVNIGDDGLLILREPTNREWNEFVAARYPMIKGKPKDRSNDARAELFDKLLVSIENIEDDDGQITRETAKDRIPVRIKAEAIFKALENEEVAEIKNS